MHLTEMSGIMAFLWSSIFIFFIYYIRKKEICIRLSEIVCIVILYIFSAIRLIIPIDFIPSVRVDMPPCLSKVVESIFRVKRELGNVSLTIAQMFLIVWAVGTIVKLIRYIRRYRNLAGWLCSLESYQGVDGVVGGVQQYIGKKVKVDVRKSAYISSPIGFGILHKIIVLPEGDYSEDELFYILLHECWHFLNRDLIVKVLIEIYNCLFWWNPLTWLLKKDLERHLEIRCDLNVVKDMSRKEVIEYLRTIVNVLKKSGEKERNEYIGIVSLADNVEYELAERFQIIVKNQKNVTSNTKTILYAVIFSALFILSYSFMPMPEFETPLGEIEVDDDSYELSQDETFIIHKKNGEYRLIQKGVINEILDKDEIELLIEIGFEVKEEE